MGSLPVMFFMDLGTNAEQEYLAGIQALRSKIESVQAEVLECEKVHNVYTSEDRWMESEYKFTACLEVSYLTALKCIT